MFDQLPPYAPRALAVLRVVTAVLFIEAGSLHLFDVPPSVHPPPPPDMETLLTVAAILYCFVFLYLFFAGSGAWSLDRRLHR